MHVEPPEPPRFDTDRNIWIVSRYADAVHVLRSANVEAVAGGAELAGRLSDRLGGAFPDLAVLVGGLPMLLNPPDHAVSREWLKPIVAGMNGASATTAAALAAEEIVTQLNEGPLEDAMPLLAYGVPDRLLSQAIGLPASEIAPVRQRGRRITDGWRPVLPLREYEARQEIAGQVRPGLAELAIRNSCPFSDGVGDGDRPNPAHAGSELREAALFFLMTVANRTTAAFLGNAIHLLAHRRDLQDTLRRSPERMSQFVNEALRYCGPIRRIVRRVVNEDVRLEDATLPIGALAVVDPQRAQRDPAAYSDPDTFLLERKGASLLTFGGGPHICLGAATARMHAHVLMSHLLARYMVKPGDGKPRIDPESDLHEFLNLPLVLERLPAQARAQTEIGAGR